VTHWQRQNARLTLEAFEGLLSQLPRLASVKLQGLGEPFLHPKLVPMLRAGESRGVAMHVITNGTRCGPEVASELLSLRRTRVTFSLDGASAGVFERIRVGSSFDQVCANIRELARLRGASNYPALAVRATLTRDNLHELADIVALVADLGVRDLAVQPSLTDRARPEMRPYIEAASVADDPDLRSRLAEARRLAQQRGAKLSVMRRGAWARRNCHWPWVSAFIAATGDVVPCCVISDPDTVKMGNAFEELFGAIWNGAAYRELRQRIADRDPPEFCRGCYEAAALPAAWEGPGRSGCADAE